MKLVKILLLIILCSLTSISEAHPIDVENINSLNTAQIFWGYLQIGFMHILPLGLDHILFILGLYLLNSGVKDIITQATLFTIAHSITLGMAMTGMVKAVPIVVEPLIALSIAFIAVENILTAKMNIWRMIIVFLFGLIHGLGFAGALNDIGLPENRFWVSLFSFNIGVELGQIAVVAFAYILIGRWWSHKEWYRSRIVVPASCLIGITALYWTIERLIP